jgi:hypothetical protein
MKSPSFSTTKMAKGTSLMENRLVSRKTSKGTQNWRKNDH